MFYVWLSYYGPEYERMIAFIKIGFSFEKKTRVIYLVCSGQVFFERAGFGGPCRILRGQSTVHQFSQLSTYTLCLENSVILAFRGDQII
jgi:hypothetical protein